MKNRPCSKGIATLGCIEHLPLGLIEKPSLLQRDCDSQLPAPLTQKRLKNRPCSKGIATINVLSDDNYAKLKNRPCSKGIATHQIAVVVISGVLKNRPCSKGIATFCSCRPILREWIEKPSLLQRDYDFAVPTWAASCLDFGLETRPCSKGFSIKNADIRRHFFR